MKLSETAIQLQILSERASHIFDDILQLVTSLDERIESITRKTEKSEEVRNGFVSIQRERSSYLTSSSDRTNTQFLIPATRDERLTAQYCSTKMSKVPQLKKLDRLLSGVMRREQTDACSKGFSDPSLFFIKWQSQQESRFVEMQAERLIRRAEGKKRRAIETKIKEDAILKRRAAEVQKTTRQKANATARSAIPLGKIDEADNSEDDLETHGSYPKPPDYETAYRSPVTFQQSETSDAIASGTDDEITRKLGVASAMLALKLRDLPIASDTNQKDVLVGSSCPPPKPPKPVKPPRHGNLTASAPALETTSGPGFQLPASSRDATGADVSSMVTRPTAPPPPLSAPKASETEMEPQPAPRPLRPKSVKFSMIFSDITEDIFYKMPTVSQSIKSEDVARHVVPNGDPLNMSDRDLYSITDRDADTVTSSRPISRRLRPPSVNLRRQRSRLSLNTLEGQRNDFIDTSAPPSLLPSPSCPHYSDASASLRRGLSTMDRAEGASSTDGGPNSLRNGMEMPGGSAVSAILARRKHLEDDSDGSDTDRDSDSDWE